MRIKDSQYSQPTAKTHPPRCQLLAHQQIYATGNPYMHSPLLVQLQWRQFVISYYLRLTVFRAFPLACPRTCLSRDAIILRTSAVVEISNLRTVEYRFIQRFIDFVMDVAAPSSSDGSRRHLRRVFVEDGAEVFGTFALDFHSVTTQVTISWLPTHAWIEPLKQVHIRSQRQTLVGRRLIRETRKRGVEELPACSA